MIRDILDIINPKPAFTATGSYYKEPPNSPDIGAQQFNYEYVDPVSRTYRRLFGNIQSFAAGETTIRTHDQLGFVNNGIVILQDGQMYVIIQVATDYSTADKQAFRFISVPASTEFVLRLAIYQDPWGLK